MQLYMYVCNLNQEKKSCSHNNTDPVKAQVLISTENAAYYVGIHDNLVLAPFGHIRLSTDLLNLSYIDGL